MTYKMTRRLYIEYFNQLKKDLKRMPVEQDVINYLNENRGLINDITKIILTEKEN